MYWPSRKATHVAGAEAADPAERSSTPSPSRRKRLREQMASAAAAESAAELVWRVDGRDVPVAPPPLGGQGSHAALCAQIAAHNSYVSAVAAQQTADALLGAVGQNSFPATGRQKRTKAVRRPAPPVQPASDNEEEEAPRPSVNPEAPVTGRGRRRRLPRASRNKTSSGIVKPRIQTLRSALIASMYADLLEPRSNNCVFLARSEIGVFLRDVVMASAKVSEEDADQLLNEEFEVPSANRGDAPSLKKLKPWLMKTMNNVHFNLRRCIFQAWADAVDYRGEPEDAAGFLEGRSYIKGPTGRKGIICAFLAALGQYSADPDKFVFPDGPDADMLLWSVLATLAFVMSKVRSCGLSACVASFLVVLYLVTGWHVILESERSWQCVLTLAMSLAFLLACA